MSTNFNTNTERQGGVTHFLTKSLHWIKNNQGSHWIRNKWHSYTSPVQKEQSEGGRYVTAIREQWANKLQGNQPKAVEIQKRVKEILNFTNPEDFVRFLKSLTHDEQVEAIKLIFSDAAFIKVHSLVMDVMGFEQKNHKNQKELFKIGFVAALNLAREQNQNIELVTKFFNHPIFVNDHPLRLEAFQKWAGTLPSDCLSKDENIQLIFAIAASVLSLQDFRKIECQGGEAACQVFEKNKNAIIDEFKKVSLEMQDAIKNGELEFIRKNIQQLDKQEIFENIKNYIIDTENPNTQSNMEVFNCLLEQYGTLSKKQQIELATLAARDPNSKKFETFLLQLPLRGAHVQNVEPERYNTDYSKFLESGNLKDKQKYKRQLSLQEAIKKKDIIILKALLQNTRQIYSIPPADISNILVQALKDAQINEELAKDKDLLDLFIKTSILDPKITINVILQAAKSGNIYIIKKLQSKINTSLAEQIYVLAYQKGHSDILELIESKYKDEKSFITTKDKLERSEEALPVLLSMVKEFKDLPPGQAEEGLTRLAYRYLDPSLDFENWKAQHTKDAVDPKTGKVAQISILPEAVSQYIEPIISTAPRLLSVKDCRQLFQTLISHGITINLEVLNLEGQEISVQFKTRAITFNYPHKNIKTGKPELGEMKVTDVPKNNKKARESALVDSQLQREYISPIIQELIKIDDSKKILRNIKNKTDLLEQNPINERKDNDLYYKELMDPLLEALETPPKQTQQLTQTLSTLTQSIQNRLLTQVKDRKSTIKNVWSSMNEKNRQWQHSEFVSKNENNSVLDQVKRFREDYQLLLQLPPTARLSPSQQNRMPILEKKLTMFESEIEKEKNLLKKLDSSCTHQLEETETLKKQYNNQIDELQNSLLVAIQKQADDTIFQVQSSADIIWGKEIKLLNNAITLLETAMKDLVLIQNDINTEKKSIEALENLLLNEYESVKQDLKSFKQASDEQKKKSQPVNHTIKKIEAIKPAINQEKVQPLLNGLLPIDMRLNLKPGDNELEQNILIQKNPFPAPIKIKEMIKIPPQQNALQQGQQGQEGIQPPNQVNNAVVDPQLAQNQVQQNAQNALQQGQQGQGGIQPN